jgi:hypothetical protein
MLYLSDSKRGHEEAADCTTKCVGSQCASNENVDKYEGL